MKDGLEAGPGGRREEVGGRSKVKVEFSEHGRYSPGIKTIYIWIDFRPHRRYPSIMGQLV